MPSEIIKYTQHSLYESTLSAEISATDTEIKPVSIGTLQDGDVVMFTIEPKKSKKEICYGVWSAANAQLESCLRGLRLYGALTEVTANKQKHSKGAKIVISDHHGWHQEIKAAMNGIGFHEQVADLAALAAVTGMASYDLRYVQDQAKFYYYDGVAWQAQTTGAVSTATTTTFGTVKVADAPAGDATAITTDNTDRLLSAVNLTDLTDAGDSALHYHATDRARANHTGTQTAATVSDFNEAAQDAVAASIALGTHVAIDITYTDGSDKFDYAVKYDNSSIKINGSNQLYTSVPDIVDGTSVEDNGSNVIRVKADGIDTTHIDWGTGANQVSLDDVPNGSTYEKLTIAQVTDLTDAGDSTLHYHAADRARANHTGTQVLSTISDVTATATEINQALAGIDASVTQAHLDALCNGSTLSSIHFHSNSYSEDPGQLTTGNQTTQQDKTITVSPGIIGNAFSCIIDIGVCGSTWGTSSNDSVRRSSYFVSGSLEDSTIVIQSYSTYSNAGAYPTNYTVLNPFWSSAQNSSMGFGSATFAAPSISGSNTSGATASLNSITRSTTDLLFNFRGVKGGAASFDLLYGVRSICVW